MKSTAVVLWFLTGGGLWAQYLISTIADKFWRFPRRVSAGAAEDMYPRELIARSLPVRSLTFVAVP
jgi:hypothetical protein